jgi:mannosyltransferase OCH1-like enzyme
MAKRDNQIPARIFQIWWGSKEPPDSWTYWRSTLIEKNQKFKFRLWSDLDNRRFIETNAPWFLPIYDGYPAEIYRCDAVRYFYLYLKGGFYIDHDTECLRPLDAFLNYPGIVLGRMGTNPEFPHSIPNAIMASREREPFWLLVIAMLMERGSQSGPPELLTGPILLKDAHDLYVSPDKARVAASIERVVSIGSMAQPRPQASQIFMLPPHEWYPIDWSNPDHQILRREIVIGGQMLEQWQKEAFFPNSSLVTYWSHSW